MTEIRSRGVQTQDVFERSDETLSRRRIYGLMEGVVEIQADPLMLCRAKVRVIELHGTRAEADAGKGIAPQDLPWALPCLPDDSFYTVPSIGTRVWVLFVRGDPDHPVWMGSFPRSPETITTAL